MQNLDFFHIFALLKRFFAMKLVILSIVLVALAVVLLGVKVLFVRGGRFPSGHVHDIEALRSKNITCAHGGEREA